ncbi:hypothetical protein L2735_15225 [Shewanella olleyana]|uniref:hypothetical protein n=1 Tax=Shewanella olleyana TaxID=135626 RepID=UPI00200C4591|nr:hypothetical protein [Shewanella olleyana]MCL1068139.1 hypothetical protein [Shewanella olleyana]
MLTSINKQKVELLTAIDANQQSLLSAFSGLKKQMAHLSEQVSQNLANGKQALSSEQQAEVKQLNTQLQRASKLKAKGLW